MPPYQVNLLTAGAVTVCDNLLTIRYIYVRSKAGDIASLVLRTAQKQKIKETLLKTISSKETVRAKVRKGRPEGRSETTFETGRF